MRKLPLSLVPVLLVACSPDAAGNSAGGGGDSGTVGTGDGDGDSAESGSEGIGDGDGDIIPDLPPAPTWPEACSDLYDPSIVPTFELTIGDAELQALAADCDQGLQNYHPVEFSYAGETVTAMARLKGNWSYSCDKYQFVISFNEPQQNPGGRFHGLRKLVLDAPWYDRTLLHERMAFPLFESLGLPYSCANSARLMINDSYYGVYTNVERLDHEYLERNFQEYEGNLYQGGAELKTNEMVNDTSNRDALFAATTIEEIEALVDLDQAVAEWAAEAMLPAMDNYWAGVEINYYLYDHPSRGFLYLPYDLDIVFGDSAYGDGSLLWPDSLWSDPITYQHPGWLKEPVVQIVLADPSWCARFVEELAVARAAYSPEFMAEQVALWAEQIASAVDEDPNKPFSMTDHEGSVAQLEAFFGQRAAFVDDWLLAGGHCPAVW